LVGDSENSATDATSTMAIGIHVVKIVSYEFLLSPFFITYEGKFGSSRFGNTLVEKMLEAYIFNDQPCLKWLCVRDQIAK
jgi:hypothetical protein